MNIQEEADERRTDFELSLGHNGSFEDDMIRSIKKIYEIFRIYFGEEPITRNFNLIFSEILLRERSETEDWRKVLEEHSASLFFETRGGELLFDLAAYAEQGIVFSSLESSEEREVMLRRRIEDARRLLELLPLEQWELEDEYLVRTIRLAFARWKIDTGEAVNAEELSLLSGKALQTIRNKLTSTSKEIEGNQNRIEAKDAIAWLATQKDFRPSIWRQQVETEPFEEPDPYIQDILFVPVANDGTLFHPGLARDGKYVVDGEGREQEIENFDEALAALQMMVIPQWRRPTPEGRWTRVRGLEWKRVPKDELPSMAEQVQR